MKTLLNACVFLLLRVLFFRLLRVAVLFCYAALVVCARALLREKRRGKQNAGKRHQKPKALNAKNFLYRRPRFCEIFVSSFFWPFCFPCFLFSSSSSSSSSSLSSSSFFFFSSCFASASCFFFRLCFWLSSSSSCFCILLLLLLLRLTLLCCPSSFFFFLFVLLPSSSCLFFLFGLLLSSPLSCRSSLRCSCVCCVSRLTLLPTPTSRAIRRRRQAASNKQQAIDESNFC